MKKKVKSNKYSTINEFIDDLNLIWQNCKIYNQEGSEIYKIAEKMEKIA